MAEFDYDPTYTPPYGTTGISMDVMDFGQPTGYGQYGEGAAGVGEYTTPQAPAFGPYEGGGPGQAVSGAGDVLGAASLIPGPQQPWIAGGALALKGVGTVASLYGKYQDRQEARRRYQQQLDIWKQSEAERQQDKALEARRRERQEGYFAGQYSQELQDRLAGAYGGYRTPVAPGARGG